MGSGQNARDAADHRVAQGRGLDRGHGRELYAQPVEWHRHVLRADRAAQGAQWRAAEPLALLRDERRQRRRWASAGRSRCPSSRVRPTRACRDTSTQAAGTGKKTRSCTTAGRSSCPSTALPRVASTVRRFPRSWRLAAVPRAGRRRLHALLSRARLDSAGWCRVRTARASTSASTPDGRACARERSGGRLTHLLVAARAHERRAWLDRALPLRSKMAGHSTSRASTTPRLRAVRRWTRPPQRASCTAPLSEYAHRVHFVYEQRAGRHLELRDAPGASSRRCG